MRAASSSLILYVFSSVIMLSTNLLSKYRRVKFAMKLATPYKIPFMLKAKSKGCKLNEPPMAILTIRAKVTKKTLYKMMTVKCNHIIL